MGQRSRPVGRHGAVGLVRSVSGGDSGRREAPRGGTEEHRWSATSTTPARCRASSGRGAPRAGGRWGGRGGGAAGVAGRGGEPGGVADAGGAAVRAGAVRLLGGGTRRVRPGARGAWR